MANQPFFDMTDLGEAKRRFDEFGQVSAQMSKAEYKKLYKAAAINEKMLRLGKRRDVIGRISFYLSLIPEALRIVLLSSSKKELDGAYTFYQLHRNSIEYVHNQPISNTTVLVTFYKKKPVGMRAQH